MLGFCAFLIHHKFCEQVKQCFLMVGHSHSDCDQYFSAIGPHVTKGHPISIPQLISLILESHPSDPDAKLIELHEVVDFKSFIKPFLLKLNNISVPLNFHLKLINGNVQLRSRDFSNTVWSNWMSFTCKPITCEDMPSMQSPVKQVCLQMFCHVHNSLMAYCSGS
jgi:hypothetical protein